MHMTIPNNRRSEVYHFELKLKNEGSHGAMVVSVLNDAQSLSAHTQLLSVMGVQTNILCMSQLYLPQLAALGDVQDFADISIIQVNVFLRILSLSNNKETLLETLRVLVSLSRVTLLEIPSTEGINRLRYIEETRGKTKGFLTSLDICSLMQSVADGISQPLSLKSSARDQTSQVEMIVDEIHDSADRNQKYARASRVFKFQFKVIDFASTIVRYGHVHILDHVRIQSSVMK